MSLNYQAILNTAGEGIMGLDPEGKHIFVNKKAASLLGFKADELIGKESHKTWHHTKADGSLYPAEGCRILDTVTKGKTIFVTDEVFWRKDGTSFLLNM